MARKKIIAGNWKMNKTPSEAVALVKELTPLVKNDDVDVVFCVPAIDIIPAMEAAKGTNINIGAENMYFEESGAYTGEIAPNMLVDAGVKYVVLGHSERREYFAETDETVNARAKAAIAAGITPIICVGESLEERENGNTEAKVSGQVKKDLEGIAAGDVAKLVIAYEPIWAIGTGKTATAEQAAEVCTFIRTTVRHLYGARIARSITIQYGGSMKPANAAELLGQPDIDGGLIGGAALNAADFVEIINAANQD